MVFILAGCGAGALFIATTIGLIIIMKKKANRESRLATNQGNH